MIDKLQNEVMLGNNAQRAYDMFVKQFIADARAELFEQFSNSAAVISLDVIQTQLYALKMLETSIMQVIETGHMAYKQLNKGK